MNYLICCKSKINAAYVAKKMLLNIFNSNQPDSKE